MYGVVFLINVCEQFFRPAQMALLGDIVAEEYRGRASGLLQASGSLAILIGPLLAPLVVVTFGVEWTLLFDALSFLVAFLTLLAMRVPVRRGASPRANAVTSGASSSPECASLSRVRFPGPSSSPA